MNTKFSISRNYAKSVTDNYEQPCLRHLNPETGFDGLDLALSLGGPSQKRNVEYPAHRYQAPLNNWDFDSFQFPMPNFSGTEQTTQATDLNLKMAFSDNNVGDGNFLLENIDSTKTLTKIIPGKNNLGPNMEDNSVKSISYITQNISLKSADVELTRAINPLVIENHQDPQILNDADLGKFKMIEDRQITNTSPSKRKWMQGYEPPMNLKMTTHSHHSRSPPHLHQLGEDSEASHKQKFVFKSVINRKDVENTEKNSCHFRPHSLESVKPSGHTPLIHALTSNFEDNSAHHILESDTSSRIETRGVEEDQTNLNSCLIAHKTCTDYILESNTPQKEIITLNISTTSPKSTKNPFKMAGVPLEKLLKIDETQVFERSYGGRTDPGKALRLLQTIALQEIKGLPNLTRDIHDSYQHTTNILLSKIQIFDTKEDLEIGTEIIERALAKMLNHITLDTIGVLIVLKFDTKISACHQEICERVWEIIKGYLGEWETLTTHEIKFLKTHPKISRIILKSWTDSKFLLHHLMHQSDSTSVAPSTIWRVIKTFIKSLESPHSNILGNYPDNFLPDRLRQIDSNMKRYNISGTCNFKHAVEFIHSLTSYNKKPIEMRRKYTKKKKCFLSDQLKAELIEEKLVMDH